MYAQVNESYGKLGGTAHVEMPELRLIIRHGDVEFMPPVKDTVEVEWSRGGSPGKLTFTTVKIPDGGVLNVSDQDWVSDYSISVSDTQSAVYVNGGMSFQEGDQVTFYVNGELFFVGYVFKKQRDRDHHIKVTCYDQLRYFKNKFSYVFNGKTATEVIKSLCEDFKLEVGEMDDTQIALPSIAEENKEAWDVVNKALNETLTGTGKMYNLMDVCGKITLKDSENMICDTVITGDTAENFDYTTSIDDETYNEIVLYYKPNTASNSTDLTTTLAGQKIVGGTLVERFVQTGLSFVGVLDERKAGKANPVSVYGFGGSGDQWCGWYVAFIASKTGISESVIPKTGASQGYRTFAQRVGKWHSAEGYTPRRGDILVFTNRGDSAHGHTGIVTGGTAPYHFTSVEGNSSNRCQERTYNGSGWSSRQFLNGFFSWYE